MSTDFIPPQEEIFYNWQENLSSTAAANAVAWNIPSTKITELNGAKSPYKSAYDVANSGKKNTRTTQQVKQKQDAQKAYEKYLRKFIKEFLAFNSAITDDDRLALQITVKDTIRTASTAPLTVPDLFTTPLNGNRIKIAMRQQPGENGVRQRGKPKGVISCEIAVWVGANPPNNGDTCFKKDRYTKSPAIITFSADDAGKALSFYARWIGAKGQQGPWSSAASEIVPK